MNYKKQLVKVLPKKLYLLYVDKYKVKKLISPTINMFIEVDCGLLLSIKKYQF